MHHFHYYAFYGCGMRVPDSVSMPISESILVTLEWMLFGSILAFKAHIGKVALIDISAQFACLCFSLFVYSIGLVAFTSIPMRSNNYDPSETYFYIATQNAVTYGLITWITTMIVALLNLVQFRKDRGVGAIRLGDDTQLPGDTDALSIRDVPSDNSM
ncbi:hypothetical protein B0J15DRAFT_512673 [Fusarium solani]|uniref:Uncharacterized protein n=1 Tax=Fusarium solani TaxID=169388 RepID=A0A9P9HBA2_FUSSL|nr:uncharacterized protein B0J15DRAFT_512673 [Fusarium solani]KAH7254403.1 hypothetical protein B0J15DRAFT_512673 [Fusarium solani]